MWQQTALQLNGREASVEQTRGEGLRPWDVALRHSRNAKNVSHREYVPRS